MKISGTELGRQKIVRAKMGLYSKNRKSNINRQTEKTI
jgi:hypothetical protein